MIAIFPEIVTCVASGDLERLSILVRRYFAKSEAQRPCMDMRNAIQNLGVDVQTLGYPEYGSLLARDDKGQFTVTMVLSDRALKATDERFLLAHMLGHYLLHIQPKIAQGEFSVSGFRETIAPWERYASGAPRPNKKSADMREVEADEFAAALLMPRSMVVKAQAKLETADKLAAFFGVSEAVMGMRLEQLNPEIPAAQSTKKVETAAEEETTKPAGLGARGMDRIRQIAKLMDRTK